MYSRPDLPKTVENGQALRVILDLRGVAADKVRAIVAREGNPTTAVIRRLVSVGLRHEGEE